ncbi:MAG: hypothetical protein U0835_22265 [Isosphaeraceae bacterium]
MPEISPKRLEANRRNAQKSTGPRTPAGKAASSKNAVKHGLAAQVHLPDDASADEFRDDLERWNRDLGPTNAAEEALVRSACRAAWKLRQVETREHSDAEVLTRHAADVFTRAQIDRAEEIGRRLLFDPINRCARDPIHQPGYQEIVEARRVDDPPKLVRELTSFREGADWLLDRWHELRQTLQNEGFLHYPEKIRLIRLLGRRPGDVLNDPVVLSVTLACQACNPEPLDLSFEMYRCMLGADLSPLYNRRVEHAESQLPPDAASGRRALEIIIEDEIAWLESLKSERLDRLAELDLQAAQSRVAIGTSTDSASLHRYETAAQRELHRSLDQLMKLRRSGASSRRVPSPKGRNAV